MIEGTRIFVCVIPKDKPLQLGKRLYYSVQYRDFKPRINNGKIILISNLIKKDIYEIDSFEIFGNCVYAHITKK